jgi:hypothetical protein
MYIASELLDVSFYLRVHDCPLFRKLGTSAARGRAALKNVLGVLFHLKYTSEADGAAISGR